MNPGQQASVTYDFLRTWTGDDFAELCASRIDTEGARQYYDDVSDQMRFERMDRGELVTFLEEELLDAANYCYMLMTKGFPVLSLVTAVYETWCTLQEHLETVEKLPVTSEYEERS